MEDIREDIEVSGPGSLKAKEGHESPLQRSINLAEVVWQALDESLEEYRKTQGKPPSYEGAISPNCWVIADGERIGPMLRLFFLQAMEGVGSDGLLTIFARMLEKKVRLGVFADPSRFVDPDWEMMCVMDLPLVSW